MGSSSGEEEGKARQRELLARCVVAAVEKKMALPLFRAIFPYRLQNRLCSLRPPGLHDDKHLFTNRSRQHHELIDWRFTTTAYILFHSDSGLVGTLPVMHSIPLTYMPHTRCSSTLGKRILKGRMQAAMDGEDEAVLAGASE
jgi:hypothetical protein